MPIGLRARRPTTLFACVAALSAALDAAPAVAATPFGFDDVVEKAHRFAEKPFEEPKRVPDWLLNMSYDQWRDIRYRPDLSLWRDRKSAFQVQFFHPGMYYDRAVKVSVIESDGVHLVKFSPSQFDYGKNDFASKIPQDLGYAGFRIHYPIKTKDYWDEVIVFLGATYFRALGKDEVFGLSARGLAIDTAESRGEEFPYFREFWLVSPAPTAPEMTVYAMLDSPSLTGAYRFVVKPGDQTAVAVECRLFMRRPVQKVGIAPLTSMFYHGENTNRWFDDFRPETHDSDGLQLAFAGGEWLWRPLDNPRTLNVSGMQMVHPAGFGLLQRDRDFEHYQDLETTAQNRVSTWIVPNGDWGTGRVELVEIPTTSDTNDNVVAYWVPEKAPAPGDVATFSYTMYWYGEDANRPPGGRTIASRRDSGTGKETQRFVIDFAGKKLAAIPADRVLRGVVTVLGGDESAEVLEQHVVKNPFTGGWRLTFEVRPKKRGPVELRAFLDQGGETLTETWSYVILP